MGWDCACGFDGDDEGNSDAGDVSDSGRDADRLCRRAELPSAPAADSPAQYKESTSAGTTTEAAGSQAWWTLFGDPTLDDLESRVEVSNQNLAASEAAYRQAYAVVREQRAGFSR